MSYRELWDNVGNIRPEKPLHIDVEISSYCNLTCNFCPHSERDKLRFNQGFMDEYLFERIIKEAIFLKIPAIKLNLRGEATLHPKFIDFCNFIKGEFEDIRINTNGQYDNSLNEIICKTFNTISFSVDATTQKTYRQLKHGNFQTLTNNIHEIIKFKKPTLSFVVTKNNINELEEFKKTWTDKANLFIRPAMQRTEDGSYLLGDTKLIKRKNCLMPSRRIVITYNGDYYPCCVSAWDEHKDLSNGNFKDKSIKNAWNEYKELLNKLKDGTAFKDIETCKNCLSRESFDI